MLAIVVQHPPGAGYLCEPGSPASWLLPEAARLRPVFTKLTQHRLACRRASVLAIIVWHLRDAGYLGEPLAEAGAGLGPAITQTPSPEKS